MRPLITPAVTAASNACRHLLPNGGVSKGNTISSADQADYLKAAGCMRTHGIPNFPDPTLSPPPGGGDVFDFAGVYFAIGPGDNPRSPAFRHAEGECGIRP